MRSNRLAPSATRFEPAPSDEAGLDHETEPAPHEDAGDADLFVPVSPFLSEYQLGDRIVSMDPASESFLNFVHELHEDEFESVLFELVADASEVATGYFVREVGAPVRPRHEVEHFVEEHFSPLRGEIDRFFDEVAREMEGRDPDAMSERQFDELLESFAPEVDHLSDLHEEFLKKVWNKAKKTAKSAFKKVKAAAKSAVKTVGSLGLKVLWPKLKNVAKQLLHRVLKYALNKIPPNYRPLATTLAKRFGILREVGETEEPKEEGFFALQTEYDSVLAGLVHVNDEAAQEVAIQEFGTAADDESGVDLAEARERFVRRMSELEEGEDPTPVIEEYVQAILMAVRLGIRLIGRKRVVNFLAKYLAQLIRKFVGAQAAVPLARVLVDSGMRLLKLEVTPADEVESARYAAAALVEDTVKTIAELPDYVIENEALLEGHIVEAMEAAASANLPPILPERVYRKKPQLREATKCRGTWVMLPLRRRRSYKKHTRRHQVKLTPHVAQQIQTFGGRSLDSFLREEAGINLSGEVEATAHLYEIALGGGVDDVVRNETEVPGLGKVRGAWNRLHPLTPAAAGMLFQEPGHGREVSPEHLADPRHVCPGQRLFFLEIPGAYSAPGGSQAGGDLSATLDFPNREVQVGLFLGESETEELLDRLKKLRAGKLAAFPIHSALRRKLKAAMGGESLGRIRIRHRGRLPGRYAGHVLKALPRRTQEQLVERIDQWASSGIAAELASRGEELYAALREEPDGVTLTATLHGPPDMDRLESLLAGETNDLGPHGMTGPMPRVSLSIEPGRGSVL